MFFKPKIVEFSNGKYGVRVNWFFGWRFVSTNPNYTFFFKSDIRACCQFETFKYAKEILSNYVELNSKISYKVLT